MYDNIIIIYAMCINIIKHKIKYFFTIDTPDSVTHEVSASKQLNVIGGVYEELNQNFKFYHEYICYEQR